MKKENINFLEYNKQSNTYSIRFVGTDESVNKRIKLSSYSEPMYDLIKSLRLRGKNKFNKDLLIEAIENEPDTIYVPETKKEKK
jgi:hypothetical protein